MQFSKLDDSPMFRKQLQQLEESAESLRDRCQKFYKGCKKYTDGLGEAYDGDLAFASALELFGGGQDDPISVAVGGPVMSKFTIALREIGTYKEVLRSQVEHMLNDRLTQFVSVDLQDVKEVRKRFDKASLHYDQVREKFLSLKKDAKPEVIAEAEEDLRNARSLFEQTRFNLVTALSNIESKKKFEFLESVSGTMDAHLRYFKQGYELLHQMEPYIHQVLTYAQQSRERANYEQAALADRMQDYRRQLEKESQRSISDEASSTGDGIQAMGKSSHRQIEAVMQATPRGKIQTIKQGYLLKRSSNLRGDWKRRFFVLDSRGMLYYYRKQWGKPTDDKTVAHHTVNLLTSTIKVDAEQSDLRFCFRIISPTKNYTLQAENAIDRMDWMDKITGVIASLLNAQVTTDQRPQRSPHQRTVSESSSVSSELDHSTPDDRGHYAAPRRDPSCRVQVTYPGHEQSERPFDILRRVAGNELCADCGAPDPDWASLNLGILVCIGCSGVHRNLGVHISKMRSLTLDVKVWEPSVIEFFESIGNQYSNSIWEELLPAWDGDRRTKSLSTGGILDRTSVSEVPRVKPDARDPLPIKEKFIQAKYVQKRFVQKLKFDPRVPTVAKCMWEAVRDSNKQAVLRLIVTGNGDVNTTYEQATTTGGSPLRRVGTRHGNDTSNSLRSSWSGPVSLGSSSPTLTHSRSAATSVTSSPLSGGRTMANVAASRSVVRVDVEKDMHGCTLLHLACQMGSLSMVELLLQYGAAVNAADKFGRTPLHHCILYGKNLCAKLLLTRGADPAAQDAGRKTPLESAVEIGAITDEELFIMLAESSHR